MITTKDLESIFNLIQRANVVGKEADEVVRLKIKIIEILKSNQQKPVEVDVKPEEKTSE